LAVLRLRLREDDRRLSPWPPSALLPEPAALAGLPEPAALAGLPEPAALAGLPEPAALAGASWPGSLSCDSGAPSVPSAAVSWSPVRPRARLERRLRRRPVPVPSSSSPSLLPAGPADPVRSADPA
jgi:hypothetical protein